MPNPVAENVLGTMGTICWCGQLLPQVWKSWRTKSTKGLSHWLPLLWAIAAVPLGTYVIVQDLNIPLIVQPQLFSFLSLVSWAQCLYYDKQYSRRSCILIFLGMMSLVAALQTGFVYALRPAYRAGKESGQRGVQFFGIMSTILISLALFPQYYEIYKYKAVIGISLIFMAVDALGGLFSDLSLAFKQDFDVIACVSYSAAAFLDVIVIVCALILNPRARKRDRVRQAALAGSTMDEPRNCGDHNDNINRDIEQDGPIPLTDAEAQHRTRRTELGGIGHDIESTAPEAPKE